MWACKTRVSSRRSRRGREERIWVGAGAAAGLAFDASGNLFVSNGLDGGLIEKFTPGGVGSVFASGLFIPGSLAFDASGTLFATNGHAQIEEFTPGGVASILGTTAAEPLGLAVQPQGAVPEPSSATLWTVALGAIGLVHYVRRPLSLAIKAIC